MTFLHEDECGAPCPCGRGTCDVRGIACTGFPHRCQECRERDSLPPEIRPAPAYGGALINWEDTWYDLHIEDVGPRKVDVYVYLKSKFGLSIGEVRKLLTEEKPLDTLHFTEMEALRIELTGLGARVRVVESQ